MPGEDEDLSKMFEQSKPSDDEEIKEEKFFGQGMMDQPVKGDPNVPQNRMG